MTEHAAQAEGITVLQVELDAARATAERERREAARSKAEWQDKAAAATSAEARCAAREAVSTEREDALEAQVRACWRLIRPGCVGGLWLRALVFIHANRVGGS